jgi:hypothetical protein
MAGRPTKTKLRLGRVPSEPVREDTGVTDGELDLLLPDEGVPDRKRKKPVTKRRETREPTTASDTVVE